MSQILRACPSGPVTIDVAMLEIIEERLMMDTADTPSIVAPIAARAEAGEYRWENPPHVHDLLTPWECHAVQQLRGWHRTNYGNIVVDARWLAEVRNVLDTLTLGTESECGDGTCHECNWCWYLQLRDHCDRILDTAGYYGGSYYEAYKTPAA